MITMNDTTSDIFTDLTLQATHDAMSALVVKGKTPIAKLAFYFAICSIQTPLYRNCWYADTLRTYAFRALPVNKDVLRSELPGIMQTQLDSLYAVEALIKDDIIHFNCGYTYESQSAWRRCMVALIPGMGLKTVSFALHIFAPMQCKLLTVDVWHVRRISGYAASLKCIRPKQYMEYEQVLIADCKTLQQTESPDKVYTPIVLAACLWERTRRQYGKTEIGSGYTSHAPLSCYM